MLLFKSDLYLCICILFCTRFIESKVQTSSDLIFEDSHRNPGLDFDSTDIHLVTVNIKDRYSTRKVIYEYDEENDSHLFTSVKPYLIDKVVKNKDVLWDSSDYGDEYGSQIYIGPGESGERMFRVYFPQDLIKQQAKRDLEEVESTPRHKKDKDDLSPLHKLKVVDSTGKHVVDSSESTPQPIQENSEIIHDLSSLLVTLNVKNRYNTDKYEYEYLQSSNTHIFTAKKPHMFGLILSGNKLAWTPEVSLFPDTVVIYPGEDGKPVISVFFPPEPLTGIPDRRPPEVLVEKPRIVTAEPLVHPPVVKPPVPKPVSMPKYTGSRLVSLDIQLQINTLTSNCFKYKSSVYFTPAFDYLFESVKEVVSFGLFRHKFPIYQASDSKHYSHLVEVKNDEVFIHFVNGTFKSFIRTSENVWRLAKDSISNIDKLHFDYRLIDLDIDKLKSNHLYDVRLLKTVTPDYRKHMYFSRREFKFKSIRDDTYVIWKATNDGECAHQVSVLRYSYPDIKQVFIYLLNGQVKYFLKRLSSTLQETWKELPYDRDMNLFRNYGRGRSRP